MSEQEIKEVEASTLDLTMIYEQFQTAGHMSNELSAQLHSWMKETKTVLEASDYVHVMHMEGCYYEGIGNKNAARYCAMRMLSIKERYQYPRKKRSKMLIFSPYEFHDEEDAFIACYTDFIQDVYKSINKKLFLLTAGLITFIFLVVAFLLKVHPFLAFAEASLLGMINFFIQKRKMPEMFQKNQTDASGKHIEDILRDFDATYRYL